MKLTGTVKDGKVAVDLPEGTPVAIEIIPADYVIDESGYIVMSPEEEDREMLLAEAEADRGEGIPYPECMAQIRRESDEIRARHPRPRSR